jgi:hypothetical protein
VQNQQPSLGEGLLRLVADEAIDLLSQSQRREDATEIVSVGVKTSEALVDRRKGPGLVRSRLDLYENMSGCGCEPEDVDEG